MIILCTCRWLFSIVPILSYKRKKKKTTKTHKVQDQLYHAQSYQSPSKGGTVTMKKTGLMDLKTVILQHTVSFFFLNSIYMSLNWKRLIEMICNATVLGSAFRAALHGNRTPWTILSLMLFLPWSLLSKVIHECGDIMAMQRAWFRAQGEAADISVYVLAHEAAVARSRERAALFRQDQVNNTTGSQHDSILGVQLQQHVNVSLYWS